MKKARILLGDDHPLIIEGSLMLLGDRYDIVGVAVNGQALVADALRLKPDLTLTDISLPMLNGIEAARRIKASLPKVKLLFLTMHSEPIYLQAAFEAGASGYLLKSMNSEDLLAAVQNVLDGQIYVGKELSGYWGHLHDQEQIAKSLQLSPREREVLHLIAEGRAAKEMASILNISVKTISFHRENIKNKLGVRTIAELTRDAIARGYI